MLDRFVRTIANASYLVPLKVNKFKEQHPDDQVLLADATKARRVKADYEAQYDMGWATARRSVLILTTNGLYCGDWTIPFSNVQEATLLHLSGGFLLKVLTTDGLNYQFGFQRNPAWEEQKVLPLNIQHVALGFSKTSLVIRLLTLAWLAYTIVQDYLRQNLRFVDIIYFIIFVWISTKFLDYLKFSKAH